MTHTSLTSNAQAASNAMACGCSSSWRHVTQTTTLETEEQVAWLQYSMISVCLRDCTLVVSAHPSNSASCRIHTHPLTPHAAGNGITDASVGGLAAALRACTDLCKLDLSGEALESVVGARCSKAGWLLTGVLPPRQQHWAAWCTGAWCGIAAVPSAAQSEPEWYGRCRD